MLICRASAVSHVSTRLVNFICVRYCRVTRQYLLQKIESEIESSAEALRAVSLTVAMTTDN